MEGKEEPSAYRMSISQRFSLPVRMTQEVNFRSKDSLYRERNLFSDVKISDSFECFHGFSPLNDGFV